MAGEDKDQKTEHPTSKKIDEARQEGNVAKSTEISSVAVLMGALGAMYLSGGYMFQNLMNTVSRSLMEAGTVRLSEDKMQLILIDSVEAVVMTAFPIALAAATFALAANLAQVGFLFSSKALEVKFDKLNPVSGFGKIFSLKSLIELPKSIMKITIVGTAAYWAIKNELVNIPPLMLMSTWEVVLFIGDVCFKILLLSSCALLVLAIIDYTYQRWQYFKNLRMTKQEVKDEAKQSEGDPKIKAKIKSLQREYAMQRMMEEVPNADVVITNPTHFAVALKYKRGEMDAPVVIAKGRNQLALKIRELAKDSGVPVVENKPLARALYKSIEIGKEVSVELYKAVAEVLSYVYRLNRKQGKP